MGLQLFTSQYNIDYRTSPVPNSRWRSGGGSSSYDFRSSVSDNELTVAGPSDGLYRTNSLNKPFTMDKTGWPASACPRLTQVVSPTSCLGSCGLQRVLCGFCQHHGRGKWGNILSATYCFSWPVLVFSLEWWLPFAAC